MKFSLRSISAAPILSEGTTGRADIWGYIFALIGTAFFAMKAIFVKLAYLPSSDVTVDGVEPVTLLALRMGFALPVYILILLFALRKYKSVNGHNPSLGLFIKAAALGALGYYICAYLDFTGLVYITAQLERMLLFTYPAFVIILGAIFFGGRITKIGIVSVLIAYSGLAIIYLGGQIAVGANVILGSCLIIGCAIFFALFQLMAKSQINSLGGILFTCIAMLGATTSIFIHFLYSSLTHEGIIAALNLPARIFLIGALIAFLSTLIPSFCVNIAIGRVGAQAVATIGMLSPAVTIVMAVWLLGEPFGWLDGVGTALTMLGIGFYTWHDRRQT